MSSRRETAVNAFMQGYNCAQSIAVAFADVTDLPKDTLVSLAAPFGGGMGRLREVCGVFSGSLAVLGLLEGYATPETGEKKKALYRDVQTLAKAFEEKRGTLICRNILGLEPGHDEPEPAERTPEYYASRPCAGCIGDMADILEAFLKEKGIL